MVDGFQKYRCKTCHSQFIPDKVKRKLKGYPKCPVCSRATYIRHRYNTYIHFKCGNKRCNHSFKKPITPPKELLKDSEIKGKVSFKSFRFPPHIVFTVLYLYFDANVSSRKARRFLSRNYNIVISHVTICRWAKVFAPWFSEISKEIIETLVLKSDEWHVDETFIKINGITHYLWVLIDSETRVVISFILTATRCSDSAYKLLYKAKTLTKDEPAVIVSDSPASYNFPIRALYENSLHHNYESFEDYLNNNFIESFNNTFKDWYKTKRGFKSFASALALITVFMFHYNFIRPHSSLKDVTPANVAGFQTNEDRINNWLLF